MSNLVKNLTLSLVIFLILVLLLNFFYQRGSSELVLPVLGSSKINFSQNIWFPKSSPATPPASLESNITAKAYFFVEASSGNVLYQKNEYLKLPIASLTKIMTVIVALENSASNFNRLYTVSTRASQMEPDKMLLIAGEKLSLEELLDGIFLVSANDGAEVLAEETTGRREEFINLMNSKASSLGMKDSLFINPTGLEEDNKTQYSTAYDVSLMSYYLINRWPHILDISSKSHIFLDSNPTHQDYDLYSGINLLTTYPGVIGLKTGYTPEAGLTLVTVAKRQEKVVVGVILGATDRRDDAKALLDASFKKLGV